MIRSPLQMSLMMCFVYVVYLCVLYPLSIVLVWFMGRLGLAGLGVGCHTSCCLVSICIIVIVLSVMSLVSMQ